MAAVRPLRRRILIPLVLLSLSGLGGVGGISLLLEGSADRVRSREVVAEEAQLLANLAASARPGHPGCLDAVVRELLRSRPQLSYLRVEDGQGGILSEVGDRDGSLFWLDRTFVRGGGPVRVRIGYGPRRQTAARAVRAGVWVALAGGFLSALLGAASLLVRRHVSAPLDAVSGWLEEGEGRPKARTGEIERLLAAVQKRLSRQQSDAP